MKKLLFIVNGEEIFVPSFDEDTLGAAREDALALSRNTSRPIEDWELRAENGMLLNLNDCAALHFGKRVYLTLALGVGGAGAFAR